MASVGQAAGKVSHHVGQQHGKERPGSFITSAAPLQNVRIFGAAVGGGGGGEAAMPEWKLKSLCVDSGLPPTMGGHLPMGGCF